MSSICVYCGSNSGVDPAYKEAAIATGTWIAENGHKLIYGGGNIGLMGAVADAALAKGGEVIGVIPQHLFEKEVAHTGLTSLHKVATMHERKFQMAMLADCFVALPGGVGTLEEIVEVFVWSQLNIHEKPCGILNVNGFYDPLLTFFKHMADNDFLHLDHLSQLLVGTDPTTLIPELLTAHPKFVNKWTEKEPAKVG